MVSNEAISKEIQFSLKNLNGIFKSLEECNCYEDREKFIQIMIKEYLESKEFDD